MKSISDSIADILEVSGVIRHEDVNQCRYGLEVLISSVLELFSILIIAAIAGNFLETLLMFAAFIPLRIYAGGYHADTKLKCYFVSLSVYAVFTIIMNVIPSEIYLYIILSCAIYSLIMVLGYAPVVHRNKTVNDIERKHYRKISITVCIIEVLIIILLTAIISANRFIVAASLGQVAETLSMAAAIAKNKIIGNKCLVQRREV